MLDWRRLNAHSLLWHLGFYVEYLGFKKLSLFLYRTLGLLPGHSESALRYRTLAASKLVPFGLVDRKILELSPNFELIYKIKEVTSSDTDLNGIREKIGGSPELLKGLWSLADMSEIINERSTAREVYQFLSLLEPLDPERTTYLSLSLYRLGRIEEALKVLDDGIVSFENSQLLNDNKLSLSLTTGNIRSFLNLSDEVKDPVVVDQSLLAAASFIANGALVEFALRMPSFLSQEPDLAVRLIDLVVEKIESKFFVFPFIEYVLGTMVRSGVPSGFVNRFRHALNFKTFSQTQRTKKNRILDIATTCNFSYDLTLNSDLGPTWEIAGALAEVKMPLSNPLSELPTWTPWVGAFVQAPRTPLWKTISKILPVVQSSWTIVDYVAPHTLKAKSSSERIKLGFLFHSSMPMISGLLPFFSKEEFETVFIYPKDEAQSKEALKWSEMADSTVEISARDLKSQVLEISSLEIDILFSGPSTSALWFVSLARLARVQAILIEPAWTDGTLNLDYYISWKFGEPVDFTSAYKSSVALLDFPPYWIDFPESKLLESEAEKEGILTRLLRWNSNERVYLCASTIIKLHPEMDEVIERILREDSHSRIVFFRGEHLGADALKARLRNRLGNDFYRLTFLNTLPPSEAHALLQSVHCVFDSFPLNGMSSSFDGLKLGVPIVTLESEISFGKWTSGIYKYIGVAGLSASTTNEFVEKCLEIASEPKVREDYSIAIRANLYKILSNETSAVELVNFIRAAWKRYQGGDAPADWLNSEWVSRK